MPTAASFLDVDSAEDFLGSAPRGATGEWEYAKPTAFQPIALGTGAIYEQPATEAERAYNAGQPSEFDRPIVPPEVARGLVEVGTMGLRVPEGVRPFAEGFKQGTAEQLSGLTTQRTAAIAPAFAVPYLGPALAYGLGAKAVGTGAGRFVGALESGNLEEAGSGASEIAGGAAMIAGPLLHRAPPPVETYPPLPPPDVVARNLAAPGTVRPQEIQRIGPTEIEAPAELYQAPRAPFTSAQRFANYEVPPPEILPQSGRLKAVEFLEETRPKEELETRGKVSFGAEAPTLLRTAQIPRELMEQIDSAERAGLSRSVEAATEPTNIQQPYRRPVEFTAEQAARQARNEARASVEEGLYTPQPPMDPLSPEVAQFPEGMPTGTFSNLQRARIAAGKTNVRSNLRNNPPEVPDASRIESPAKENGNLRAQPIEGTGEVPAEVSGQGILARTELQGSAKVQEQALNEAATLPGEGGTEVQSSPQGQNATDFTAQIRSFKGTEDATAFGKTITPEQLPALEAARTQLVEQWRAGDVTAERPAYLAREAIEAARGQEGKLAQTGITKETQPERVVVQAPFEVGGETSPGYVTIQSKGNAQSGAPEAWRAAGHDIEDFSKLPQGTYTIEQARELLKAQEKPASIGNMSTPEVKQPWEMSKKEYAQFYHATPSERARIGNFPNLEHARSVREAIRSGQLESHPEYPEIKGLTPIQRDYQALKKTNPSGVMAVRLGDFYEFFFDDAKLAAKDLRIALTKRGDVEMAGVPYHAAESYFNKLRDAGHDVHVVDVPKGGGQRRVVETFPSSKNTTDFIQRLEALKVSQDVGGQLRTNPLKDIPVAVWNGAIDAAILAVKAGRTIADGIELAIQHIRKQVNKFDEKAARDYFTKVLQEETKPTTQPTGGATGVPAGSANTGTPSSTPTNPARGPQPVPGSPPVTLTDVYKRFSPTPPAKPSLKERAIHAVESFRTGFSSSFRPLNKLAEDIAKQYGGTAKDVAGVFEQLKGSSGKAEADVYRFDKDVSELVKGNEKDFSPYMFLRRSIDRLEQDARDAAAGLPVRRKVSTYTVPDLQAKLAVLESNLGPATTAKFQRAADLYQQHMDSSLQLQVASGRMSPQVYADIKADNQFYAPFKVMKYIAEQMRPEGTGRKVDTLAAYTKAMEGIDDADFKLGDMLAAARQNIALSRTLAEKNYAMREIADLAALDTQGTFVHKLAPGADPPKGYEAVNILEGGKPERYAVNKDVADAVQASPGTAPILLRWAGSIFRSGVTTFNLPFQAGNLLIADQPRAALVSKYGVKGVNDLVQYPMDFYESALAAISHARGKPNKLAQDFLDSGAAGATVQEYLTPESLVAQPKTGAPLRALSTVADIAQAIEETSKIIGVKRAMREHGAASGGELGRDYPEAITEIRRFSGSPDFGRMGKTVDGYRLNLLHMFLNARIQGGVADIGRLIGRDGAKTAAGTWIKVGAAVGTPTLALYILNHSDKYAKDYEQISEKEKRNYWLIPKDSYIKGPNGEQIRDYWRIPKREIAQWFANGFESTLDFARLKDPEAFWKFATDTGQQVLPVNIEGRNTQERLESVAAGFNPLIKAPLEVATGRDLYRHKNIIPDVMKKASPEGQYTDRTPEAFKMLANAMPDVSPEVFRSPLMIENMVKNTTGGMITQFLPRKPVEGRSGIENTALLQRFQRLPFTDDTEFQDRITRFEREAADEQLARFRAAQKILDDNKGKSLEAMTKVAGNDPKLIERLVDIYMADKRGISSNERRILALPVEQRAAYLADEFKGKTALEKEALIRNYAIKRILTDKVAAALAPLMAKEVKKQP